MPEVRAKLYRGWWYAVWSDDAGKTQRRALRTQDRDEAERRLIDFRRDMSAPIGALVGDIVQAYLDDKRDRIAAHDRLVYGWKRARETFAHLRPDQITRDVCRGYIEMRRLAGVSDGTVLKEINIIRQAMNWRGVKEATFEAPSAPPPRERHLTKDEYRRLLDGCVQPHVKLYIVLALMTAGRKTAILDLTWDRVDFERGLIRLGAPGDDKSRKGRATVPMTDRARTELEDARKVAQTPFVIEYAGARIRDIQTGFQAAVKRARLEDVHPHDLRHSAAVWMAESGVSMEEIAQYLGHTDPGITFRVYARFSPSYLRKAARALDF